MIPKKEYKHSFFQFNIYFVTQTEKIRNKKKKKKKKKNKLKQKIKKSQLESRQKERLFCGQFWSCDTAVAQLFCAVQLYSCP